MMGAAGIGNTTALYQALPATTSSTLAALGGSASGQAGQSSAAISPLGQLFSNLQQLQTQNPARFQQTVATIAGQLQSAAQQQGATPAGQFLTNLANKFTNLANGGSVSQMQPHHHHHGGHHRTYNSAGQASSTDSTAATSGTDLQQLFASISSEVSQALVS